MIGQRGARVYGMPGYTANFPRRRGDGPPGQTRPGRIALRDRRCGIAVVPPVPVLLVALTLGQGMSAANRAAAEDAGFLGGAGGRQARRRPDRPRAY
ncbi:hypothetical protein GCM10011324_16230 [Allosediminivita pacifica]|nr:hypothetical protein GCM10011324_16230 [Allosediminivita pacifica]